jgi:hypothetical protein
MGEQTVGLIGISQTHWELLQRDKSLEKSSRGPAGRRSRRRRREAARGVMSTDQKH